MAPKMMKVEIRSSGPIYVEADPEEFGRIFSEASSDDQANILSAMMDELWAKGRGMQPDYVWLALGQPKFDETRQRMAYLIRATDDGEGN